MNVVKLTFLTALTVLLTSSGCQNSERVAALEQQLQKSKDEVEVLRGRVDDFDAGSLIHIVWFDLKPDLTGAGLDQFVAEIRKLDDIPCVMRLEVGQFEDLGDERAMSELELVMSMGFDSKESYGEYQAHPIHLGLKEAAGKYLAGPPVTYDYSVER